MITTRRVLPAEPDSVLARIRGAPAPPGIPKRDLDLRKPSLVDGGWQVTAVLRNG